MVFEPNSSQSCSRAACIKGRREQKAGSAQVQVSELLSKAQGNGAIGPSISSIISSTVISDGRRFRV